MDIRYGAHPNDFKTYTTERIQDEFLVRDLFTPDGINLTYTHIDRLIIGGVCPTTPQTLTGGKQIGADYFLSRRELGIINIGPSGVVTVDGTEYSLAQNQGLYVGMGAKDVVFTSDDPQNPAYFYLASGPAHKQYPICRIEADSAEATTLGSSDEANSRTIRKYIHPEGVQSCQLVMGMTSLEPGSVWNTMACHTHERRMEAYFYFNLPQNGTVFHMMGQPDETRHIIVRNQEAVISPSWSIHSGVGTSNYTFIWAMLGENQTFTDMDAVGMEDLR
jgi:4-deoxy-L-threo-5-hexosulose-uronate ketol-isomerase